MSERNLVHQNASFAGPSTADGCHTTVIHPRYTEVQLKIENCTQFAFGQDPSGKSVIWAAGKAGWFEIVPSTRYALVYEDIVTAIDLIYFLSDTHQAFAASRPIRGAKVDELLMLYQQHTDYTVDNIAEAEAILAKNHSFLIRQMSEGWEGINWARTHIWSYFSRLYPDEVVHNLAREPEKPEDLHEDYPTSEGDNSKLEGASSNGRDNEKSWADVIFKEIMHLQADGHVCKRHCSVDRIAEVLVEQYNLASKMEASGIIKDAAESILLRFDTDRDQGGNRTWSRELIYRQLQRLIYNGQRLEVDQPTNDIITPTKAPPHRHHHKSILRPSTGAGKGRRRTSKAQSPPDDDHEEEGDYEETAQPSLGMETPTKKRRMVYAAGNSLGLGSTNGSTMPSIATGLTSNLQLEQLDLIRKESVANGRLNVAHLEALVEGLIQRRN